MAEGDRLHWYDGVGICRPTGPFVPYDAAYLAKYDEYAKTDRSKGLVFLRRKLVDKYLGWGEVLDFGCATPVFQNARRNTFGYDIIPGVEERLGDLWRDPYRGSWNMTFWDSLEHLAEPEEILGHVKEYAFISLPIFRGREHAMGSKHFRPGEHVWYFTSDGLIRFMDDLGFDVCEENRMEETFGREDIGTFVFRRR